MKPIGFVYPITIYETRAGSVCYLMKKQQDFSPHFLKKINKDYL